MAMGVNSDPRSLQTLQRRDEDPKIPSTPRYFVLQTKRELSAKDRLLSMQERANKGIRFHEVRRGCEI